MIDALPKEVRDAAIAPPFLAHDATLSSFGVKARSYQTWYPIYRHFFDVGPFL